MSSPTPLLDLEPPGTAPRACGCASGGCPPATSSRAQVVAHALRLEYATIAWNVLEGGIAIAAATAAGSVALLGFGLDSFVECGSGLVLVWRLRADASAQTAEELERVEHRARRLVAGALFVLAAYVALDAGKALWMGERPSPSAVGVGLTSISIAVMSFLARAKRRAAVSLGSRALEADAFQTTACWWLSIATLAGLGANALLGWWWADPAAAIVIAVLIVREGREAWAGRECC